MKIIKNSQQIIWCSVGRTVQVDRLCTINHNRLLSELDSLVCKAGNYFFPHHSLSEINNSIIRDLKSLEICNKTPISQPFESFSSGPGLKICSREGAQGCLSPNFPFHPSIRPTTSGSWRIRAGGGMAGKRQGKSALASVPSGCGWWANVLCDKDLFYESRGESPTGDLPWYHFLVPGNVLPG